MKNRTITRRVLSLLLVLVMLVGMLPAAAFAAEESTQTVEPTEAGEPSQLTEPTVAAPAAEGDAVATVTTADGTTANYNTLDEAIAEAVAAPNSTVTLLKDITTAPSDYGFEINGGAFTLNLNGYQIAPGRLRGLTVTDTALTVTDNSEAQTGKITAESVAVYVQSGSQVTILGGTYNGSNGQGLLANAKSSLTVEGGTFTGDDAVLIMHHNVTLTIRGGTFNGTTNDLYYNTQKDYVGTTAISGGTFTGGLQIADNPQTNYAFPTVAQVLANSYCSYYVGDTPLSPAADALTTGTQTVTVREFFEASLTTADGATTNYNTLADAITDAQSSSGSTVTLLQSVDYGNGQLYISGGTFTLDLNGQTITSRNERDATVEINANGIDLTITDSSPGKTGTISNAATTGYSTHAIWASSNSGTLRIYGGNFISTNYNGAVLHLTTEIYGGTFESKTRAAVSFNTPLTIYDGSFTGNTAAIHSGDTGGTLAFAPCQIYGGTFVGTQSDLRVGYVSDNISYIPKNYILHGGTFPGGLTLYKDPDVETTLADQLAPCCFFYEGDTRLTTYASNTNTGANDVTVQKYVEATVTTANGTTTEYPTLADAITAAQGAANSTLTLQRDITTPYNNSPYEINAGNFTLDLNGKAIDPGTAYGLYVEYATLTITDSSEAGTGGISGSRSAVFALRDAHVTIQSGTYSGTDLGGACVSGSCSLTIEGGSFSGEYAVVVGYNNANLTIKGGTFDGTQYDLHYRIHDNYAGTTAISGGTFTGGLQIANDPNTNYTFPTVAQVLAPCCFFYEGDTRLTAYASDTSTGSETVIVREVFEASVTTADGTTTNYHTLAEAVEAVKTSTDSKTTVKVLQDVDLGTGSLHITSGVFTLDLNGRTITTATPIDPTAGSEGAAVSLASNASSDVSIDLTIVDSSATETTPGTGAIKNTGAGIGYALYGGSGNKITIHNGNFYAQEVATLWLCNSDTVIHGGTFHNATGDALYIGTARIEIYDGSFTGAAAISYASGNDATATVGGCHIYGGTFEGSQHDLTVGHLLVEPYTVRNFTLYGGTFPGGLTLYKDPDVETTLAAQLAPLYSYFVGDTRLLPAADTLTTGTDTVTVQKYVEATVTTEGGETTEYATLAEAITAAQQAPNSTVTLLRDITTPADEHYGYQITGGTFTLELNGKVIDLNSNHGLYIWNSNTLITLTIQDSSQEQTGGISASQFAVTATINAHVTIKNGTYSGTAFGGAQVNGKSSLTIEDGSFSGEYAVTVGYSNADLSIKGGTFNGGEADLYYWISDADYSGTTTLSGGTFPGGLQIMKTSDPDAADYTYPTAAQILASEYNYFEGDSDTVLKASAEDPYTVAGETVTVARKLVVRISLPQEVYTYYGGTAEYTFDVTPDATEDNKIPGKIATYFDGELWWEGSDPIYDGKTGQAAYTDWELGEHTIQVVFTPEDTTLDTATSNTVTFTLEKVQITAANWIQFFALTDTTQTYDGTPKAATLTSLWSDIDQNLMYVPQEDLTLTYWQGDTQVENPTNAGTYTLKLSMVESTYFKPVTDLEIGTLTIDKADLTQAHLDSTVPGDGSYNGLAFMAKALMKTGLTGYGKLIVEYRPENEMEGTTEAPTAPGTYTVWARITGGDNFNAGEVNLGSFNITKTSPGLSVGIFVNGVDSYTALYEDEVTIRVMLGVASHMAVPTGTFTILANGQEIGTFDLKDGMVEVSLDALNVGTYQLRWRYSGDEYYNVWENYISDNLVISPKPVTLTVTDTAHRYDGTAKTVSFTNNTQKLTADDFTVTYYLVNENMGTISKVNQAVSTGRYLYVVELKDEFKTNYTFTRPITIDGDILPEGSFDNAGFMDIEVSLPEAQEPIYFEEGAVTVYLADGTYAGNTLINPNGTDPTYSSSNDAIAAVAPDGTVTLKRTGTVTIFATSEKEGTTPVRASYTLTVEKKDATITVNGLTTTYGEAFTLSAEDLTLTGCTPEDLDLTNLTFTGYTVGQGVGTYYITPAGITSEKYDLTFVAGTLTVQPREIDASAVSVSAATKIYDGTTDAVLTAVLPEGAVLSGDKVSITAEGAYTSADAGTTMADITALTLEGKDADNYVLVGTAPTTAAGKIEQATVTFTTESRTFTYDGYAKALDIVAKTNNGLTAGYTVTYSDTPILPGTYTVAVTLTDTVNYTADTTGLTGKTLTITAATQQSFTIGGLEDGIRYGDVLTLTAENAEGTVSYEITEGTAAIVDGNTLTATGVGKIVITATSVKAGYADKQVKITVTVGKRQVTPVVASVTDRTYDGTTAVTATVTLQNVVNNDVVSAAYTAEVQTPDADDSKTVTITLTGLTGAAADLYELTATTLRSSVDIAPKPVAAIAFAVSNKYYDGTAEANILYATLTGILTGDRVSAEATATFDDVNAGADKDVTLADVELTGTDAANYVIDATTQITVNAPTIHKVTVSVFCAEVTTRVFDGNPKRVDVSAMAGGKVFTAYTVSYAQDGAPAEPVNVGEYDVVITLNDPTNYELADYVAKLVIEPADQDNLTIEGIPDRVYYGDSFTVTVPGALGDVTYKVTGAATIEDDRITATGVGSITLTATVKRDNYEDQIITRTFTANPRVLTATATPVDRAYDGTTAVDVTVSLDNVLPGDEVNVSGVAAQVVTPDARDGKYVTVTISGLTGADAALYELAATTLYGTVDISPREIDASAVTVSAATKIYDGTTDAVLTAVLPEGAVLSGDKVSITAQGAYTSATAGTTMANITALTLEGKDADNYVLRGSIPATALGMIEQATVTFTAESRTFTYDGTAKALDIVAKTNNGLTAAYTVAYSDTPVLPGTYTVAVTLTDTVNYVADVSGLEGKTLTITAATQQSFTIGGLEDGIRYGDSLTLTAENAEGTVTFAVTEGDAATITGNTLTAVGVGKIVITATSVKAGYADKQVKITVTVGKRQVTPVVTSVTDRTYDGTTAVTANVTLQNVVNNDDVSAVYTAEVQTPDADDSKTVTVTLTGLTGAAADLYELTATTLRGSVNIAPKPVDAIAFAVSNKYYDGTVEANVLYAILTGILGSDRVSAEATATFDDVNAGADKDVTLTDVELTGTDAANYVIDATTQITVNAPTIHKVTVSIFCAEVTTRVFDGNPKRVEVSAMAGGKVFTGYTVSYAQDGTPAEPINVGTYDVVITLTDPINYELADYAAKLVIEPADQDNLTIEGIPDRVYYGDSFTVTVPGALGDVTYEVTGAATIEGNRITATGVGTVTLTATVKRANYEDQIITRTFTAYPRVLTATATAENRTYNGKTEVSVTVSLGNVAFNDNVTATARGQMATSDAGEDKLVYVTDLVLSDTEHYTLDTNVLQTTVDIARIVIDGISVTAEDKVYDGTDEALIRITGSADILPGDEVTISGTGRFASADAGTHAVTVTATGITGPKAQNYALASGLTATTEAEIIPATVAFEVGTATFIYDGQPKAVEVTAALNGKAFTDFTVTYDVEAPTDVGTYEVTVTLNDSRNYTGAPAPFTMVILPADQDQLIISGMPGVVDYGKVFTLTTNAEPGATVTWATSDETVATVDENGTVTILDVDREVTITATASRANHNDRSATVTFTPVARQVTFQLSDLTATYNGSAQGVTVKPSVEGMTDYEITYTDESGKVVTPVDAGTYHVEVKTTGNKYTGYTMGTFTVRKATLSGTLTMEGWTYGESAKEPTYTLSVQGITPVFTYSGQGLRDGAPCGAGDYTVTATFAADNYETLTLTAAFEVKKATLTVTAADATRAYGESNPALTVSITGFVNGDTESDLLVAPTATTAATTSSDVGEYPITAAGGRSENYTFTYVSGTLTVVPAQGELTITGASHDVTVGQELYLYAHLGALRPNVLWSSSDETVATVDEDGKVTIVGAGTAVITARLNEKNYVAEDATFRLSTAEKTVSLLPKNTVFTYNGTVQSVEFSEVEGFVPVIGENVQVSYTLTTDPQVTTLLGAGTYVATYEITDPAYQGSGTFTVYMNKATRTLRPADLEKTYGEENPAFTIDPEGLLGEDVTDEAYIARVNAMFVFTCAAETGSLEGSYTITMALAEGHSLTEDPNYNFVIDETPGTLIIRSVTGDETCPSAHFTDLDPAAWYHSAVDYVVGNGLMQGVSDTRFAPRSNATRAMIVTVLYRMESQPDADASGFTDVSDDAWYAKAVAWAAENGIVLGYGDDTFRPNQAVTREELALIMYRYAAWKGCDTDNRGDLSGYQDVSQVSPWAREAMTWANATGLIQGRSQTTLVPKGTATRVELAAILMRFLENILK